MPSRRIRQHVNPLRSTMLTIPVEPVLIPAGRSVEVELGSAEATFLIERARERPDSLQIGVEIREPMVRRADRNCRVEGVTNVVNVFANMRVDLPRILPLGSVERMFLNFPDPWFKPRQHKRRVADTDLVDALIPMLAPAGEIYVNTDIFDLALDAMAALEAEPRLENQQGPWLFARRNPVRARSRREQSCEAEGVKIWRLAYRLRAESESLPRRQIQAGA